MEVLILLHLTRFSILYTVKLKFMWYCYTAFIIHDTYLRLLLVLLHLRDRPVLFQICISWEVLGGIGHPGVRCSPPAEKWPGHLCSIFLITILSSFFSKFWSFFIFNCYVYSLPMSNNFVKIFWFSSRCCIKNFVSTKIIIQWSSRIHVHKCTLMSAY